MKKLHILLLAIVFLFQSCVNKTEEKKSTAKTEQTTKGAENDSIVEFHEEFGYAEAEKLYVYPKTGNKAEDFLPKIGIYEIQYEGKGDLNNDGLIDIAVVLVNKEVKTDERPMLILLQNKDQSYRLDKVSNTVIPIEYAEEEFQLYISEEVSIKNGVLKIQSFGAGGPIGNLFSSFKYMNSELILTFIETYNSGAGSWQKLYYDLEKNELTEEITNTMKEEMPTKEKKFNIKKVKYLFENTSPDKIISEAYKKIDSDW